jgi:transposase-like protein
VIAVYLEPGVSMAAVALANGLNANFLRSWGSEDRAFNQLVTHTGL